MGMDGGCDRGEGRLVGLEDVLAARADRGPG